MVYYVFGVRFVEYIATMKIAVLPYDFPVQ